ncbi:MAG: cation transporter [Chloroflexi bacterium]|nr:cation transporter [Chloroflexota bacterium]
MDRQTSPDRRAAADHGGAHQHGREIGGSRRRLLLALGITAAFLVVELVGGLLTNSLALLSDAGHMLADVASLMLALLVSWVATRPPSPQRTFGYRRAEILGALVNGLALWLVVAYVLYEALLRLNDPPQVDSAAMLAIAGVGLGANLLSIAVLRRAATASLNIRAALFHVMGDLLGSLGAIIAGSLMLAFGWYLADAVASIAIAVLVFVSSLKLLRQTFHILMEGTPPGLDLHALEAALHRFPGVSEVHDLHAWMLTSGYNAMSAHILVEPHMGRVQRDQLLTDMRRVLTRRFDLHHVTIQLEESAAGCDETYAPGCRDDYHSP